jgi:hypothetical protein
MKPGAFLSHRLTDCVAVVVGVPSIPLGVLIVTPEGDFLIEPM